MFIYLFIFCPVAFPSPSTGPDPAQGGAGSGPVGGQNQAPPWAWFWCRFLPVKREVLLPSVSKYFAHRRSPDCLGSLCDIVESLTYRASPYFDRNKAQTA